MKLTDGFTWSAGDNQEELLRVESHLCAAQHAALSSFLLLVVAVLVGDTNSFRIFVLHWDVLFPMLKLMEISWNLWKTASNAGIKI